MSNQFTEADLLKLQQRGMKVNDPVIDQKLKKAFGIKKQTRTYSGKEKDHIEWVLIGMKLEYKKEFRFHDTRKFRFDYCIPEDKIAIEYEGIYGDKSGHTNVKGYTSDSTKYNLACVNGWRVLRYTADNYMNIGTDLEKLLINNLTNK